MTTTPTHRGTLTTSTGSEHARIIGRRRLPARARRAQLRDRRARSTPRTSGSASAPASSRARFAARRRSVVDMAEAAAREAITAAGLEPSQIGAVVLATVTHPYQTPAAAPIVADRLGIHRRGVRHLRRVRRLLPRHLAWPTTWSAAAAPSTSWSSASRSCPTSPTPTTAGPPSSSATAPARPSSARPTLPASARRSGAPTAPSGRPSRQRDPWVVDARRATATCDWPAITMQGQAVFRWAVWGMAPVAQQAIDAAGVSADDLDAFIPHQANMRIIDAMIKQLKLPAAHPGRPRHRRDRPTPRAASIPLATERMLREGEAPHGGLALQIGFGAGPGLRRAGRRPALTAPAARRVTRVSTTAQAPRIDTRKEQHPWRRASRRSSRVWPRSSTRRPAWTPTRSSSTSPSPTTSTSTPCR